MRVGVQAFSKTDSVVGNVDLKTEAENVRARAKRLRKRSEALVALWDRTFKDVQPPN